MPWRPLPQIAFAICTYPFQPESPADLPLQIGDELYIIEQGGADGAWYRGYLVAPPSLLAGLTSTKGQTLEARVFSGIFPRVCVEVREILGDVDAGSGGRSISGEDAIGVEDAAGVGGLDAWPVPPSHPTTPKLQTTFDLSLNMPVPAIPLSVLPNGKDGQERDEPAAKALTPAGSNDDAEQEEKPHVHNYATAKPPAPVPMLKIGDETPMSREEPLVDEIASCLREWHSTNLHELLLSRRYDSLDKMITLVTRLDNSRRQLLHGVLTKHELDTIRESAVWDLVNGNKMLSGEVVVRSPSAKGRILSSQSSPIEIAQLQSIMSLLDKPPELHSETKPLNHLLVDVRTLYSDKVEGIIFSLQVCAKANGEPLRTLSEVFTIDPAHLDPTRQAEAEQKLRTLFIDLSAADVGDAPTKSLRPYLVVRVFGNEPCRLTPHRSMDHGSHDDPGADQDGPNAGANWRGANPRLRRDGGRRSLTGLAKGRGPSARPNTGYSAKTGHLPTMEEQAAMKNAKPARRTVAAGLLDISDVFKQQHEIETDIPIWCSPYSSEELGEFVEFQDDLVKELLQDGASSKLKLSISSRVRVHLRAFTDADSDALVQATPTLLQNIQQTRKIGFSGAPTKQRSDIYLTLVQPNLPRNATLSHPKLGTLPLPDDLRMANLQLTLEVRKMSGERIESCIFPSSNSSGHTAWRTTAVQTGEGWNQTIRLAVAPEDVPGCHIVMSIADAPNFPFALCWMPLWTMDAFVRDGEHSLVLHKYDEYTSSMISGRGAYLSLPWNSRIKDESVTGPIAAIRLSTFLCSTKYSQDPDLLSLLKWRESNSSELVTLLKRFQYVPEIEIVKLLDEVFDALFDSLVEHSGNDEVEDLVFHALVIVLGIVHDRRFNLQPLVDQYADAKFSYPFATACLIRSFTRLLSSPDDPENARRLRETSKVGGPVLRFIVNALQQLKAKEVGIGLRTSGSSYSKDLQTIFTALDLLMRNQAPVLVGTKTLIVQNFHTWVPELYVMSPDEVFSLATNFIESCSNAQGRFALYRLILINNLTSTRLLPISKTQAAWRANTQRWLAPYWGYDGPRTQQWRDQIRSCCSIVATEIEEGFADGSDHLVNLVRSYRALQEIPRSPSESLSILFPLTFPFTMKPTTTGSKFDEGLIEIAALLAAIGNSPNNLRINVPEQELSDFIFDSLRVFESILDCEAFPKSWLSVHIYQHRAILKMLDKIMDILCTSFLPTPENADDYNTNLWRVFFLTLFKLVSSEALALETFPEQKRRAAWKIAGDVREAGADLLQRSWEAIGWETSVEERNRYGIQKLGGYQVQYVPNLVGPVLELCLSVHDNLRRAAVTVLQNMIISEWILSADLTVIQAEMIDCLDQIFKTRYLTDSMLQKSFITELTQSFEFSQTEPISRDDPFFLAAGDLIGTIDELLDLLVAVHSSDPTGETIHIMDTLHLMEFLRDVQKEDIYIAYVHKLAQIQESSGNPVAAGLALKLHSDLYEWDATEVVQALDEPQFPAQTAFERKEQIYFQMVKYFEDGLAWPQALDTYEELAKQYQNNTFDFGKLARTQRASANIRDRIAKGERNSPRYFRVIYRGLGFPTSLRDKQFIFEGLHTDRLITFTDRLQQQYPSATILSGGAVEDFEGQYLSVYAVSPQKNLLHPVNRRTKVASSVREHFMYSMPKTFATTSKRETSNVGIMEQVVQKTLFTTAESFPNILRRSEVVSVETSVLPPVQIGLERTIRKTQELAGLLDRAIEGGDSAFAALTEGLTILVNRDSNGCIAGYWDLVTANTKEEGKQSKQDQALKLYGEALKVAFIDHVATIKRSLDLYNKGSLITKRAEFLRGLEANFAPVLKLLDTSSQAAIPYAAGATASHVVGASPLTERAQAERHRLSRRLSRVMSEKEYVSPLAGSRPRRTKRNSFYGAQDVENTTPPPPLPQSTEQPHKIDDVSALNDQSRPASRLQNIQARMGSVGRRLSTLNNRPKGKPGKVDVRNNTRPLALSEDE